MKNRFTALFLIFTILATLLSSCNSTPTPAPDGGCTEHSDSDGDGRCDACKAEMPGTPDPTPDPDPDEPGGGDQLPSDGWDKTTLLFELSVDVSQGLTSGACSYLSGEVDSPADLEAGVKQRNDDAEAYAGVDVSYVYYPGGAPASHGVWGASVNHITELATSTTDANRPDIFCNYEYDLFAASLRGAFANLYGDGAGSYGVDVGERGNYFSFVKDGAYDPEYVDTGSGYMIDYMRSLALSEGRMYIVASDYFIDTVRAMLVIPVNARLFYDVTAQSYGGDAFNRDYDGDGKYELSDFYELVERGGWTYSALRDFAFEIEAGTLAFDTLDGIHGFALGTDGIGAAGFLYTSTAEVIKREVTDGGSYEYAYADSGEALSELVSELGSLFSSEGMGITFVESTNYGTTPELAIRNRFSNNKILFGGVDYFGSLEDASYQSMYGDDPSFEYSGFGLAPIPLEDGSTGGYSTTLYNAARSGAIAAMSNKFAQCSAFLDYQSTHSGDVLDAYIRGTVDKKDGNVDMAYRIRAGIGGALDRVLDNEIIRRVSFTPANSDVWRWTYTVTYHGYAITYDQMLQYYSDAIAVKRAFLDEISADAAD